jgi:hypothetical protein
MDDPMYGYHYKSAVAAKRQRAPMGIARLSSRCLLIRREPSPHQPAVWRNASDDGPTDEQHDCDRETAMSWWVSWIEELMIFTVMLNVEPGGRGSLDVENAIKAGDE